MYVPQYVVGHWYEHLLHNQSALRLRARLMFSKSVVLVTVPRQLSSAVDRGDLPEGDVAAAVRIGTAEQELPGIAFPAMISPDDHADAGSDRSRWPLCRAT